jgi:radical SAM protein with 4Fe4S-binding SPASM domain
MQLNNPEVRIENTNLCNASCIICPRDAMTRKKVTMPNRHFNYLVDQAVGLGAKSISIFGFGEPLLDRGIINKVAYCTKKGLDTFITTNASLLNTEMQTLLLKAGLKKIRFSVHGVYKNYDRVHQKLRFEDTIRNIQNFLTKNIVRFKKQCTTAVSVIPMNSEELDDIVRFWQNGVDELEVWKPHGWGGAKDFRHISKKRRKTCGRHTKGPIQIQADGDVIPCCFLTNAEVVLGNTYVTTLKDIINGRKYDMFRACHKKGALPCVTCDQLNTGDSPLLYSTLDKSCSIGRTSSTKFNLED